MTEQQVFEMMWRRESSGKCPRCEMWRTEKGALCTNCQDTKLAYIEEFRHPTTEEKV